MTYRAPIADLLATMSQTRAANNLPAETEEAEPVLEQAAALAQEVLAPLDRVGDRHGVSLGPEGVRTAPGWREAYETWTAGGWNGLTAPEESGGSGLSQSLGAACFEIWSGANLAFALAGLLTSGAIEAVHRHASDDLKARFLPKLVSGTWPGTMNLTEPQAGSDLGALRCRAERAPDGSYRIFGQKIYITYGDHDMTENILHLVLARLPDAPAGTRGISLFLVPKVLVDHEGRLGGHNDLRCVGLESKLGMHAAPTCTMSFGDAGGAVGFLIGEEHRGLACMFTMMNNARLAVGLEGVAAAENATQKALAFARERRQGRGRPAGPEMIPIIRHPDVARMLMTMKAYTAAARCLCHLTAAALDAAREGSDTAARREAAERAAFLTPVAKAFSTDIANEVASLGVQVHGGMGYIEDTGAAQILRDIRIAAIYEGTNGIQAIDFATRKLPLAGGTVLAREIADMRRTVDKLQAMAQPGFGHTALRLSEAVTALENASAAMQSRLGDDEVEALAAAAPYLRLFAIARGGTALADLALARPEEAERVAIARFFAESLAPAATGLERIVLDAGAALADDPEAWLRALD
ncbi:acyl-CoA dehydrogenase [Lichenifustis flavocetrariae]|uniref:3-methylmercaptopropionyl-CoA dehydrogenase n=1 Tax=Lichenifustis flavocetrariae TaxID=2949735 RepID=A0AA41YTR8_9HYPH|nr:acyl-CoA dehydrogenase [Lichenifustis flavocetrariae]MCW6507170.1 acyl-CoA dehydrogenase [Lichenifustis flavocetrariae]